MLTRETALPWDTIQTTKFRAGEPLDSTISSLLASHDLRSQGDPDFQYLVDGIRDIEEVRAQKSVSLNIDNRMRDREENMNKRLERENSRRAALELPPIATIEELETLDAPDVHLDQAADIVTDLAVLREVEATPTQIARSEK